MMQTDSASPLASRMRVPEGSASGLAGLAVAECLSAFVDNALMVWVLLTTFNNSMTGSSFAWALSCFLVPYLVCSVVAAWLCERTSYRKLITLVRFAQVVVCFLGAWTMTPVGWPRWLFLAMIGCVASIYGPARYGILPGIAGPGQLSKANGIVAMTRFLGLSLGVGVGVQLSAEVPPQIVWLLLGVGSVAGWVSALLLPSLPRSSESVSWGLTAALINGFREIRRSRSLYLSVVGIAYFWFLVILLRQTVPVFVESHLEIATGTVAKGMLLAMIGLGAALGGVAAAVLSAGDVELGLVPLGTLGLGLVSLLVFWVPNSNGALIGISVLLIVMGMMAAIFHIPLLAMIQWRSPKDHTGAVMAANGVVLAAAMLASAWLFVLLETRLGRADWIFVVIALVTWAGTAVSWWLLPEFFFRFLFWLLTHSVYRIRVFGRENISSDGAGLLICNHVSYLDGFFIIAGHHRMVRFVVWSGFADSFYLRWLSRIMGVISISPSAGPRALAQALRTARDTLRAGELVCIFAEGQISRTGNMLRFKRGFEKIIKGTDAPIIPTHLDRVWGSVFSFQGGRVLLKWPKEIPYSISVGFGPPLRPNTDAFKVQQRVQELGSELVKERKPMQRPLHRMFVRMANRHCFRFCMADSSGVELSFGKTLAATIALSRVLGRTLSSDEKMVGVLLPPSVGGSLANLALLCAGKIPINLNYTASAESIASCIEQCEIKTVISSPIVMKRLKIELPMEPVAMEQLRREVTGKDRFIGALGAFVLPGWVTDNLLLGLGGSQIDDLVTVIFSSGSTGDPKGVMLSHHNVLSNCEAVIQVIDPNSRDRLAGVLPLFHSFGFLANMWVPFMVPCGVIYHNNPLDSKVVGELVEKYRGSILLATPTFLRTYTRRVPAEQFRTLRFLIVGAEKLSREVARAFKEKFNVEPLEGYGCTELSPVAAVNTPDFVAADGTQIGNKPGTVGHPLPGVVAKVVDPDTDQELGPDQEGLLMIKGPNVMQGYLNKPELTAAAIKDGWYVTGDIGSIDEDGFIKITGRLARFAKIGGEMVGCEGVEEAIQRILDSEERLVAVTSVPDRSKGERLVVLHTELPCSVDELWQRMNDESGLPQLWVPARNAYLQVEEFPNLGTGKLDLRAVRRIAMERTGSLVEGS